MCLVKKEKDVTHLTGVRCMDCLVVSFGKGSKNLKHVRYASKLLIGSTNVIYEVEII